MTDVTIAVGGGLVAINAKRVTVTYTHSYMFVPGHCRLVRRDLRDGAAGAVSEMRKVAGS